jgi:peroxiredoxin Q/BCP
MPKDGTAGLLKRVALVLAVKVLAALALMLLGIVRFRRPLAEGGELPRDLRATDQEGKPLPLGELLHEPGWNLVFFFPRAGTGGCTRQACNLRDAHGELRDRGVRVFGVSGDSPEALRRFREKQFLPYTLIADGDGRVARAFGISRVGPASPRHTFLIREGKVLYRQLWAHPETQAEDILDRLENFRG